MCEKNPGMKVSLGHDGPALSPWRQNLLTGEPLQRCPLRSLQLAAPAVVGEVLRMEVEYYPHYRRGHLLVEGGLSDQPARYVAMMREIDETRERAEAKYAELKSANTGDE